MTLLPGFGMLLILASALMTLAGGAGVIVALAFRKDAVFDVPAGAGDFTLDIRKAQRLDRAHAGGGRGQFSPAAPI